MIKRSLLSTWIYFQIVTFIKWDLLFCIEDREYDVLAEYANDKSIHNPFQITDFHNWLLSDNEIKNNSACTSCEQITDTEKLTHKMNTNCDVSADLLEKVYALILQAYNKIMFGLRSSRIRNNYEDLCDDLVDNCRNSSLLPPPPSNKTKLNDSDCDNLLAEMEEKMFVIIEQLELLIELIDDPEQLYIKIAQLQNCVQCLQEKIDVIIKQAAEQVANCYETGLAKVTTCFATQLNQKTKKIEELEIKVTNKSVNSIVANVQAGNFLEAAIDFRELKNYSLFDTMMDSMFRSGQIASILNFGRALYHNNITGRAIVYTKLMELLYDSKMSDTQNVTFSSFVNRDRIEFCGMDSYCLDKGLPDGFIKLGRFGTFAVRNATENWKVLVRNNNFRGLILFGSPEVLNFTGEAFHDVLVELITKSYNKTSGNLDATLNFTMALRWNTQSYTAFKCLLDEASGLDDKLKIGIEMKVKMDNLFGPDNQQDKVRLGFNELVKQLPDSVRGLVWNEICTMWDNSGRYLQASSDFSEGGNRLVNKISNPSNSSSSHKWRFERVENSGGRGKKFEEFRIKNVRFDNYLGTHIPWKYYSVGLEWCAVSTPDYFEIQRKFYNWRVHYQNGEVNKVFLYHVGRRGYQNGQFVEMSGKKDNLGLYIKCEK